MAKPGSRRSRRLHRDSQGNLPSMHMNEHGITLRHGEHKGRLIRPSRYYGVRNHRDEWPSHYTGAVYSDDHGKTWHTSDPFPENGTGEAAVAELSNGKIYYNSRVHWQERPRNTRRREAWSTDGGHTWKDFRIVDILPDGHQHRSYGCMGGLVRLPVQGRDILIFSNIDTPNATRERGTVWGSFDGGKDLARQAARLPGQEHVFLPERRTTRHPERRLDLPPFRRRPGEERRHRRPLQSRLAPRRRKHR